MYVNPEEIHPLMMQIRLAMAGILSAVKNKSVVWFGLLCSSFTRINTATSRRSSLVPLGDTTKKSVKESNTLAARTAQESYSVGRCCQVKLRQQVLRLGSHLHCPVSH